MCYLYSLRKGQQVIRDLADAIRDLTGNLTVLPGVFLDYFAPLVRVASDSVRELAVARWGMPSPVFALKGGNSDPGVINVGSVASPHCRRWLSVESRCVVAPSSHEGCASPRVTS
jgi:putative SOS response-associated peptidase YedK